MSKYHFVYLVWLLPAFFIFHGTYQILVFNGLNQTFENGDSYVAEVIDFDVKQIAAQTNGYVVLRFNAGDETIEQQLALSVQMSQVIMDSELIPVRYDASSFEPIVMMPTYSLHTKVVQVNMAVTGIGLVVTFLIALGGSRFANRRIRDGEEELVIEYTDSEPEIA